MMSNFGLRRVRQSCHASTEDESGSVQKSPRFGLWGLLQLGWTGPTFFPLALSPRTRAGLYPSTSLASTLDSIPVDTLTKAIYPERSPVERPQQKMLFSDLPVEVLAVVTFLLHGLDTLQLWNSGTKSLQSKLSYLGVASFRSELVRLNTTAPFALNLPFKSIRALHLVCPTFEYAPEWQISPEMLVPTLQTLELKFPTASDFFVLLTSETHPIVLPSLTKLIISTSHSFAPPEDALTRLQGLIDLSLAPLKRLVVFSLPDTLTSLHCVVKHIIWDNTAAYGGLPAHLEQLKVKLRASSREQSFPSSLPPSLRRLYATQSSMRQNYHALFGLTLEQLTSLPRGITDLDVAIHSDVSVVDWFRVLPPQLLQFNLRGLNWTEIPLETIQCLPKTLERLIFPIRRRGARTLPYPWPWSLPKSLKTMNYRVSAYDIEFLPKEMTELEVSHIPESLPPLPPLLTHLSLMSPPPASYALPSCLSTLHIKLPRPCEPEVLSQLPPTLTSLQIISTLAPALDCSFFTSLPKKLTHFHFQNSGTIISTQECLFFPSSLESLYLGASRVPSPNSWNLILPPYLASLEIHCRSTATEPAQEIGPFGKTPFLTKISLHFQNSDFLSPLPGFYLRHLPPRIESFDFWSEHAPIIPARDLADLPTTLRHLRVPFIDKAVFSSMKHVPRVVDSSPVG